MNLLLPDLLINKLQKELLLRYMQCFPHIFQHTNYFAFRRFQQMKPSCLIVAEQIGVIMVFIFHCINMKPPVQIRMSEIPGINIVWEYQGPSRLSLRLPTNKDPNAKVFPRRSKRNESILFLITFDLFGLIFVKDDPDEISKLLRGKKRLNISNQNCWL